MPELKILDTERNLGLKFPDNYRKFLLETDGKVFKKQSVKILTLAESVEYLENMREFGITQTWGYFPILDNEDSNPWCICCKPPLAGYIVQVRHDDSAQIKFRSFEGFLERIQASDGEDVLFLDDLEGDFQASARTSHDIEVARDLAVSVPNYKGVDRGDACRFAMWLFGDEEVDQITPFLDDEDSFVARDASDRLGAMQAPKAKAVLRAAEKDLAAFIEKCLVMLKEAGIQTALQNGTIIRLSQKNILLDMKTFYTQRKGPDANQKFIQRVQSFLADT